MDVPPVQYVTTPDGFNIAYAVRGEGLPLVRAPSLFGHFSPLWSRGIIDREFEALAAQFRLVLFDHRGQGSSSRGLAESPSLDNYVRDLELLVDRLELPRFLLLGWSGMAKIAVEYALRHPDRVIALLLQQYSDPFRGTRLGLLELAQSDWQLLIQTAARVGWPWAPPETVSTILRDSISQADFMRQYNAISESSGDEMLKKLTVPTLVMATREDSRPTGGEEEAKRIAAIIPGSRLVLFDDVHGGFDASGEGPPPALDAIQRFLAGLPDAGPHADGSLDRAGLSGREVEVLRLLATGRSNRQIADELVISQNTVIRHVSNIFGKTGVANRAQATAYAKDRGIA